MACTTRLLAALVVLALAPAARAQPEVAPPPHVALAELVRAYQRFGLPDPAKAELVRVTPGNWSHPALALQFPPPVPHATTPHGAADPIGWYPDHGNKFLPRPIKVAVEPTPAALNGVWVHGGLEFAVQCKLRGWDELATAAYAQFLKREELELPREPFARLAWGYWDWQLSQRDSDRRAALAHLRAIHKLYPEFLRQQNASLFDDLERTLAPRTSKPGTPEALIDDLTDYWEAPHDRNKLLRHDSYWKLAELGLDAVPALLKHVGDRRKTRAVPFVWPPPEVPRQTTVGELVESLLNGLSSNRFEREHEIVIPKLPVAVENHKWWAEAREVSEERWLLANVFPSIDDEKSCWPHLVAIRAIRAKYPNRLKELYERTLRDREEIWNQPIVDAIVASKLPFKEKIAALGAGLGNADLDKRVSALNGLAELDPAAFRKRLFESLNGLSADERGEWNFNPYELVRLLRRTDDPECWKALSELRRRTTPTARRDIITSTSARLDQNDAGWRTCLRFLLDAANDEAMVRDPFSGWVSLGDLSLMCLGELYGFNLHHAPQRPVWPRERSLLFGQVRDRAELELARPAK